MLFITHDIDEAILLGDHVHVMTARPGRIKEKSEIGLPRPRSVEATTTEPFIALRRRPDPRRGGPRAGVRPAMAY